MKVVAFNGSPHKEGNTWQALKMVAAELEAAGIETQIVTAGDKPIQGCIACGMCAKNKNEKCVLPGDEVNAGIQLMKEADGILLGSPVHYPAMSGAMKSFLDRAFYVAGMNGGLFRHKVGASVVAVRRSGGIPARSQSEIATSSGPSFSSGSPAWTDTQIRSQSSFRRSRRNSVAYSTAPSLKYCPNEKLPSISKKVR